MSGLIILLFDNGAIRRYLQYDEVAILLGKQFPDLPIVVPLQQFPLQLFTIDLNKKRDNLFCFQCSSTDNELQGLPHRRT